MTWQNNKPNEHRFDFGVGDILVVHGGEVSRAHLFIGPTFWRTDSGMPAEDRAVVLAAPLPLMKRQALTRTRDVLRAALAAVEAEIETPVPSSDTIGR